MTPASGLRTQLADTLAASGPDAPTLCEGWTTSDLLAHLLVRERRPDAAPGIVLSPLAGWTARVTRGVQAQGYDVMVDELRTPPSWSPLRLAKVDDSLNTMEFAVHLEDVRRGAGDLEPLPIDPTLDRALWRSLTLARRLLLRRAPTSVRLETPDGRSSGNRSATVTLVGDPLELLLFCFGRQASTHVEVTGPATEAAELSDARLGF